MQGVGMLADGIQQAGSALGDSISKEYERNQANKDDLDAFLGMGEYMTKSGAISQSDLDGISKMPFAKAKGYMTSLIADASRKQRMADRSPAGGGRGSGGGGGGGGAGKASGIIYEHGRPYRLNPETGKYELLIDPAQRGAAEVAQTPVVDRTTGKVLYTMPKGSKFAPADPMAGLNRMAGGSGVAAPAAGTPGLTINAPAGGAVEAAPGSIAPMGAGVPGLSRMATGAAETRTVRGVSYEKNGKGQWVKIK